MPNKTEKNCLKWQKRNHCLKWECKGKNIFAIYKIFIEVFLEENERKNQGEMKSGRN
jgi:hypothetical protein